jgi:hypothetical protein
MAKAKKELEKKISRRNTEFCDAAEKGDTALVEGMIHQYPDIINSTGLDNWSALHYAVSEGIEKIYFYPSFFRK